MKRFMLNESKTLDIVQDSSQINQFAVFQKNTTGMFWQQISPWYFNKGNAIRFYNKKNVKSV